MVSKFSCALHFAMDSLFSTMAEVRAGDGPGDCLTGPEDQSTLRMGSQTLQNCKGPGNGTAPPALRAEPEC